MIVANWKMHFTVRESLAMTKYVIRMIRGGKYIPNIVICPSYTSLSALSKLVGKSKHIHLGAQNMGGKESGAFTGEVSARQLTDLGCSHVILGHSERRKICNESHEDVNAKLALAFQSNITPIVCIGESEENHKSGDALTVIENVVKTVFKDISASPNQFVLAYEPTWAISTEGSKSANSVEVVEALQLIRKTLSEMLGGGATEYTCLYGGSVDGDNAREFLKHQTVNGLFIGGASLKPQSFQAVIEAAKDIMSVQS